MKKVIPSLLAGLATLLVSQTASAYTDCMDCTDPSKWYVQGSGGVSWMRDLKFGNFKDGSIGTKVDFKTGFGLNAAIGHIIDSWHMQLEGRYQSHDIHNLTTTDVDDPRGKGKATGTLETWALMANLLYEFNIVDCWNLFLGGGIGIAHTTFDRKEANVGTPLVNYNASKDSSWSFAWQLLGGVSYDITETLTLFTMYRFFAVGKGGIVDKAITRTNIKLKNYPFSNNIELGVRIKF